MSGAPKTKSVSAWLVLSAHKRKPVRLFWSRLVAREEAKSYPGSKLVRALVTFTVTP